MIINLARKDVPQQKMLVSAISISIVFEPSELSCHLVVLVLNMIEALSLTLLPVNFLAKLKKKLQFSHHPETTKESILLFSPSLQIFQSNGASKSDINHIDCVTFTCCLIEIRPSFFFFSDVYS